MAIINPIPHYRKDIDGLRAIAVLAVVFFHAFPSVVRGGFIGVDIFFVISGFLISTILLEGLARDTFSLTHFYRRRIVRIFPALLLVLVSCLILGWFILLTDEYAQLGKHIAGGAGFLSNYLFWNEAGYFDQDAETKPLLHLWSLGIEEQFYILWPALLWLTYKSRLSFALLILLTGITSFFWGLQTLGVDPSGAFYLPQNRFWELLVGTGLAYVLLLTRTPHVSQASWLDTKLQNYLNRCLRYLNSPGWKNGYSVLGMSLLAFGIYRISKDSHFPGTWVLLPVFGATLLILAGPNAWLNCKVLGHRYLVWCGLISFPLYLWHWPLLAFARITQGEEPSGWIRISIVLLSIILAWLTYWLIEKPIRFGSYAHSKLVLPTLIVLMTAIGLAGYWDYREGGEVFKLSLPNEVRVLNEYSAFDGKAEERLWNSSCFNSTLQEGFEFFTRNHCDKAQFDARPWIFLVGDSHSAYLSRSLRPYLAERKLNLQQYSVAGCMPLILSNSQSSRCNSINFNVISQINLYKPKTIILFAHYSYYENTFAHSVKDSYINLLRNDLTKLKAMGVQDILIIGQMPIWKESLSHLLLRRYYRKKLPLPERSLEDIDLRSLKIDSVFADNNFPKGISYLSLQDLLCNEGGCLIRLDDRYENDLIVFDSGHLTTQGAKFVIDQLLSNKINK